MKHLRTLLIFVAIVGIFPQKLLAERVNLQAAQTIAEQWRGEPIVSSSTAANISGRATTGEQIPAFYVFNYENDNGFAIVSSDTRTRSQILAYSPEGHFDWNKLSETEHWWLEQYAEQKDALQNDSSIAAQAITPRANAVVVVVPMIQTAWGQNAPFNDLCPLLNGTRTITGCVATGCAMLCKFYSYPASASGSYSYTWAKNDSTTRKGTINSTYDYSLMRLTYNKDKPTASDYGTAAERNEVAKLNADIANMVEMNFGTSSSGSVPAKAIGVMVNTFGYDKGTRVLRRTHYDNTDWDAILRDELDAGRPVLYAGWTSAGAGHFFICDGYQNNGYFHFNFGWTAIPTTYYLSSAVSGSYNYKQEIAVEMQPNKGSTTYGVDGTIECDLTASVSKGLLLTTTTFSLAVSPNLSFHSGTTTYSAICMENTSTGNKYYTNTKPLSSATNNDMHWTSTPCTFSYSSTASLPDGTYRCYPVYKVTTSGTYRRYYVRKGYAGSVSLIKSGSSITVGGQLLEDVQFSKQTVTLNIGETLTTTPTFTPSDAANPTFRYTSSAPSVATVEATTGKVTAVQLGSATITATAQDGSELTAQYVVNVTMPANGTTITVGNKTYIVRNADSLWVAISGSDCSETSVTIPA